MTDETPFELYPSMSLCASAEHCCAWGVDRGCVHAERAVQDHGLAEQARHAPLLERVCAAS